MARIVNRRQFIKSAAALTAGSAIFPYVVPSSTLGKAGMLPPSERINLGFIGTGNRGSSLLVNFLGLKDCRALAACDVKKPQRDQAKNRIDKHYNNTDCKTYNDFREVLARKDIDAVVVATPDHWHVAASLEAIKAGKDVYMEKPLGVSFEEGKVLRETVKRYGKILQFGTQERSSRNSLFACETVLNGRIGKLKKVIVSSRRSIQAQNYPPMPVPDWIDYNLWPGPAPFKPYTDKRVINEWWFHINDYSLGFIAGCGIHTIDIAQMGSGKQHTGPVEVEGTGIFPTKGICDCATNWNMNLKYEDGLVMNFTDEEANPLGIKFEGEEGWVFVKEEHLGGKVDAFPKSLLKKPIASSERKLPFSNHHQQNFLDCCKTRNRPVAAIDTAVRSDTLVQLCDISMRLKRKVKWDPKRERIVGDTEAARKLSRPMRSPWHL